MNLYYMIWVDAILSFKKYHPNDKNWKLKLFIYITWIHTMNLWIVLLWLKYFNILSIPILELNIFPGELLDNVFAFIIEFALLPSILNYIFIFYQNRYEKIIIKYKNVKIRYAPYYSFGIAILTFISVVLYGALTKQW